MKNYLRWLFVTRWKKVAYYNKIIRDTGHQLWDMEARILVVSSIREGIRKEYDKLNETIKAHIDAIDKIIGEVGLPEDTQEKLEEIVITEELSGLDDEARAQAIEDIATRTRKKRAKYIYEKIKKKIHNTHGAERRLKEKEYEKKASKIVHLLDMKASFQSDANAMKEQMFGKWSEKTQSFEGGIDQEIAVIEKKQDGGMAFRSQIRRELRRIKRGRTDN